MRTVADARGGGVLAKAQYLNAHLTANARATQVEVLRKECERLRRLHARAVALGRSQLERTFRKWMGASVANAFHGWRGAAKAAAKAGKEGELARQLAALTHELETQRDELKAVHAAEVRRLRLEVKGEGGTQREIDRLRTAAVRSAGNRLRMAAAAAAFTTWADQWGAARKAKHVLRKFTMSRTARAVEAWKGLAGRNARVRARLQQVAGRLVHRRVASAWEKWAGMKQQTVENRLKVERMLFKMRYRHLNASFARWADMVLEVKSLRTRATRAMSRLRNRNLSQGFRRWGDFALESASQRRRLEKALTKMKHRELAAGFARWKQYWQDRRKMRVLAARASQRFRKVPQARGFHRWRDFVGEKQWVLGQIDYILRRLKHRAKAGSFLRWAEMALVSAALRTKLVQALQRFRHVLIARSWNAWLDVVDEMVVKREAAEAVLTRLTQRNLVGAVNRWREFVAESLLMRARLQSVLGRMRSAKLTRIWNSWHDFKREAERQAALGVAESKREEMEEIVLVAALKIQLFAMRRTRLRTTALRAWRASTVAGHANLALCRKILMRVQNRGLAAAFDGWVHAANTARRQRHVVGRARMRLDRVTKRAALVAWANAARGDRVANLQRRADDAERVLGIRTRHNMAVCVPLLRQLTNLHLDPDVGHEVFALFDFLVPKAAASKRRTNKDAQAQMQPPDSDADVDHAHAEGVAPAAEDLENPAHSEKRFRGEQRVVEIVNAQLMAMQRRLDELEDRNRNLRIERETAVARVKEEMEKKHKFDVAALRRLNAQETRAANDHARQSRMTASVDDRMTVAFNNASTSVVNRPTPGMMLPSKSRNDGGGGGAGGGGGGALNPHNALRSPVRPSSSYAGSRAEAQGRPQSASSPASSMGARGDGTSAAYRSTTFRPPPVRGRLAFE